MKTPMKTSAWWMPSRSWRELGLGRSASPRREVAVPADEHGGQADEAVQQRDELGHAGHLDDAGPPQADRGADDHGDADAASQAERCSMSRSTASAMVATSATAMPAMPKALPRLGGLVLGQPGERQDEQQRRDDVGRLSGGCRWSSRSAPAENIASMRRVTAKPPKTLMLASRIATNASDGDRRRRRGRSAAARRRR